MDAMSHHSGNDGGDFGGQDESNADALRQVAAGVAADGGGEASGEGGDLGGEDTDVEADLRRLFRM